MRIALLTPRRQQSEMLIRALVRDGFVPDLVLFHDKVEASGMVRIRQLLKGYVRSVFFFRGIPERVRRMRSSFEQEAHYQLTEYASRHQLDRDVVEMPAVHLITRINQEETAALLRAHNIDILFIWGVPIIRPIIIQAVNRMVINAHSSILPEYRGARSEFWQCYHQDFSHAGITLHQVDTGVDTGDILLQVPAESVDRVNPERLRVSNAIRVIEGLPALLQSVQMGDYRRVSQDGLPAPKTPTYRIRDIGLRQLCKVYLGIDLPSST